MPKNDRRFATAALLLATLFWGMTFALIRDAVTRTDPFNFLFWRFSTAALILFAIQPRSILRAGSGIHLRGAWIGLFLAGTVVFQTIGLQTTAASTASFLTGSSVVMVPVLHALLAKVRPPLRVFVAVASALAGIAFISYKSPFYLSSGDLWILLCALFLSFQILLAGKYSQKLAPVALTFMQLLVCAVVAGIIGIATHTLSWPHTPKLWISIIFCSVFASIFSVLLQMHYQKYVSATKAAIIFAAEPLFATATAVALLGERLTTAFIFGGLLIFMAIFLAELRVKRVPQV